MIATKNDDTLGDDVERVDPGTRGSGDTVAAAVEASAQATAQDTAEVTIEVRPAVGDDHAGVLSVGHRTWLATYEPITGPEYVAMGLAKWWTSDVVTDSIRKGRTIVAVDGGEVVGVATFGTQRGDFVLWKLYVLPGHHGHGIGSRLMDAVVERALDAGHTRIVLSYIEGNKQAAGFYARHGFVETHRESGGSGLPVSVWMSRELEPAEQAEDTA